MNNEPNWELLAKYVSDECSDSEKKEIEFWINASGENKDIYDSVKKIWESPDENFDESDINSIWGKVKSKTVGKDSTGIDHQISPMKRFFSYPLIRYAAVFIFAVSISVIYYFYSGTPSPSNYITLNVANGTQEEIILSDGSKVIIDAGSIFEYPKGFLDEIREVKLVGEAYFEVQNNPDKKFRVISKNAIVTVLGTKFNIRAIDNFPHVSVAVSEGRVSLSPSKKEADYVIVNKGYRASIDANNKLSQPTVAQSKNISSWIIGEIYFEDVILTEVINQLERWYDVQFEYDEAKIKNERLTLSIHNKSLDEMLELISGLTGTNYVVKNRTVTITQK
jgi:ferric-dicitrate binding protein FerR (iron transport regulator)